MGDSDGNVEVEEEQKEQREEQTCVREVLPAVICLTLAGIHSKLTAISNDPKIIIGV